MKVLRLQKNTGLRRKILKLIEFVMTLELLVWFPFGFHRAATFFETLVDVFTCNFIKILRSFILQNIAYILLSYKNLNDIFQRKTNAI